MKDEFAFAFAPLAGRCAQVREGLRWLAPKAEVWSCTLCTLTCSSTNHFMILVRFSIDKTVFMSFPELWIWVYIIPFSYWS